jgi:hypothetical protein
LGSLVGFCSVFDPFVRASLYRKPP